MAALIGKYLLRVPGALSGTLHPLVPKGPVSVLAAGPIFTQITIRNYAARKGTRARKEKALKAKKAAKKEKEAEIPKHLRHFMASKMRLGQQKPLVPDFSKREEGRPTDNVYFSGSYQWPEYELRRAIENTKEVHHPTMFDNPKAVIKAYFELNLSTKKKTQFVSNVSGVIEMPHIFETDKPVKTVCVFATSKEDIDKALKQGAEAAVGTEGIRMFQEGNLDSEDYDVIIAHPDIVNDLAPIRGLFTKKFPNIKKGTVGYDLASLVKKFKNGIDYEMVPNLKEPSLGMLQVPIGTANMEVKQMEENYLAIAEGILEHKAPGVSHSFIARAAVISQYSSEKFLVSLSSDSDEASEEDDDPKEAEAQKV